MKVKIVDLAYVLSLGGFLLSGLIVLYLGGRAVGAGLGFLPEDQEATFELPVSLSGLIDAYPVQNLDEGFAATKIELKRAELEVLPTGESAGMQAFMYLLAGLYVGCFSAILFFLSRMLRSFRDGDPFAGGNVLRLRWLGGLALLLSAYPWLMHLLVYQMLGEKFSLQQGSILAPSWGDWDGTALFLGVVILAIAEAFRHGTRLQELEELTV